MLWLTHQQFIMMDLQQHPRETILSNSCKHLWTSSLPGACVCRVCSKIHVFKAACLCHASHAFIDSLPTPSSNG